MGATELEGRPAIWRGRPSRLRLITAAAVSNCAALRRAAGARPRCGQPAAFEAESVQRADGVLGPVGQLDESEAAGFRSPVGGDAGAW